MIAPTEVCGSGLISKKNFVQVLKTGFSDPVIEYGTTDVGREMTCFIAVQPGDQLSVRCDLASSQADIVDLIVDGILRNSSINTHLYPQHRKQFMKMFHYERRKSGIKGALKSHDIIVKDREIDAESIIISNKSSSVPLSSSDVGTIELKVFKPIAEKGTQVQAERGPTIEDYENWWNVNPNASSDTPSPKYNIGISLNPKNTTSNVKKFINEPIQGYFLWASFKFKYRSAFDLQAAGFPVHLDRPLTMSETPTSVIVTSKATSSIDKMEMTNLFPKKNATEDPMDIADFESPELRAKDSCEIIVSDPRPKKFQPASTQNTPMVTEREDPHPENLVEKDTVTMLQTTLDEFPLQKVLEVTTDRKVEATSEVEELKANAFLEIPDTQNSLMDDFKVNERPRIQSFSSQTPTNTQSSTSDHSWSFPTEIEDQIDSQKRIKVLTTPMSSQSITDSENSITLKDFKAGFQNQETLESSSPVAQGPVITLAEEQTPEPDTGILKGLGIMTNVRKILQASAQISEVHPNICRNLFEKSNSSVTEAVDRDGDTAMEVHGESYSPSWTEPFASEFGFIQDIKQKARIEAPTQHLECGPVIANPANHLSQSPVKQNLEHVSGDTVIAHPVDQSQVTPDIPMETMEDQAKNKESEHDNQDGGITQAQESNFEKQNSIEKLPEICSIPQTAHDYLHKKGDLPANTTAPALAIFKTSVDNIGREMLGGSPGADPSAKKRKIVDISEAGPSRVEFNGLPSPGMTPSCSKVDVTEFEKFVPPAQILVQEGAADKPGSTQKNIKVEKPDKVEISKSEKRYPKEKQPIDGTSKEPSIKKRRTAGAKMDSPDSGLRTPAKTPTKPDKKGKSKMDTKALNNQSPSIRKAAQSQRILEMRAAVEAQKAEAKKIRLEIEEIEIRRAKEEEAEMRLLEEELARAQKQTTALKARRLALED